MRVAHSELDRGLESINNDPRQQEVSIGEERFLGVVVQFPLGDAVAEEFTVQPCQIAGSVLARDDFVVESESVAVRIVRREDRQILIIIPRWREDLVDIVGGGNLRPECQPASYLVAIVDSGREALLVISVHGGILAVVACGEIAAGDLARGAEGDVCVHSLAEAEILICPVGVSSRIAIVLIVLIWEEGRIVAAVHPGLLRIGHVLFRIH